MRRRYLVARGVMHPGRRRRPPPDVRVPLVAATIHPSAILRARDDETRQAERRAFTEDLRKVADTIGAESG